MKNEIITFQYFLLVLVLLLVLYTIYYIRELKSCECFKINDDKQTNLNFIEFYEYLELFAVIVIMFGLKSVPKTSKKSSPLNIILLLGLVTLYLAIKYNLIINVYKLSQSIKEGCECSDKWQRFFIYYQGIVSGIEIVQYLVSFILLALLSLNALL